MNMYPDHSDMRMYADLVDLNRGFLGLLTEPGGGRAASGLGLNVVIVEQLRRLSPEETEFIAGTPGLLACFARLPQARLLQVAEIPADRPSFPSAWRESARLYVTGVQTWLWQLDQHDWPCCALCVGPGEKGQGMAGEFDFTRIRTSADFAVDRLRARFTAHPSFWTDLIRSARNGDEDLRALSQLTVIPLVLAEEYSAE
jgi:hypothetical protein